MISFDNDILVALPSFAMVCKMTLLYICIYIYIQYNNIYYINMYLTDFPIQELKGVSDHPFLGKCCTILLCQVQEEPREDTWSWYVSVSSSQFECGSNDCDLDE